MGQTSRRFYDLCVRGIGWIAAWKSYFFWHAIDVITSGSGLHKSAWKSYFTEPIMLHIHFRDNGPVPIEWVEFSTCFIININHCILIVRKLFSNIATLINKYICMSIYIKSYYWCMLSYRYEVKEIQIVDKYFYPTIFYSNELKYDISL